MYLCIEVHRADPVHLMLDDFARVLIAARAVAGAEQGDLARRGFARGRMFLHDFACPGQEHIGHAFMSPHWPAVIDNLDALVSRTIEGGAFSSVRETQLPWNDLFSEVAFADE